MMAEWFNELTSELSHADLAQVLELRNLAECLALFPEVVEQTRGDAGPVDLLRNQFQPFSHGVDIAGVVPGSQGSIQWINDHDVDRLLLQFCQQIRHLPCIVQFRKPEPNMRAVELKRWQAFPPEEASRLMSQLEIVYTPRHGSWLNMAEPELSVLTRQCLSDRVESQKEVKRRTYEWESNRNTRQKGIDWQFTTDKARTKLKRLYPNVEM